MSDEALQPIEQKQVLFYEDEVTAVRISSGEVFVPIRPISDNMDLNFGGQRDRINRDPVLSDVVSTVRVTRTEGNREVARELLCLPLKFIPGWLFGINANRVKPEIRDRLIRYQKECYDVLSEAFQEGRLTADPTFDDLMAQDTPEAQAVYMARAVLRLAENQLMMRTQIDDHTQRLEAIEAQLGDPGRNITPDQASQLSQAIKTVAMPLSKASGSNQYGSVYGELYRHYGITSYKLLPASKFKEAMDWLTEWHQSLVGDTPF